MLSQAQWEGVFAHDGGGAKPLFCWQTVVGALEVAGEQPGTPGKKKGGGKSPLGTCSELDKRLREAPKGAT